MSQTKDSIINHSMDHDKEHTIKGSEVFVGGLPRTVTETKIHEVFADCGEIMEVRLIKDQSGKSKGYCFVRFTTREAADKAIKEKSAVMIEGKKIGVLPSNDQTSLFLGNLRKDWSPDQFDKMVREAFQDVVSVDLATPPKSMGNPVAEKHKNRGFAFVKFSSHAAAARAYRIGSKADFVLGGNWHPNVEWAQEEPEVDPEELAKIKIAFVRNLPTDADEKYLKKLFEPFGKVEKVVLSRKGSSQVGFVHFDKRSDLDSAIKGLNEKMVQGPKGGASFELQVEVAKPIEKTRKRAHDSIQSKPFSKTPTDSLKSLRDQSSNGHRAKSFKLKHSVEGPNVSDPYEAAVVTLPVGVKERLLRLLRLGIATRFDIDIRCIKSLNELPELVASHVLDEFMLTAAEIHDKAAYLSRLISKQLERLGLNRNPVLSPRAGEAALRGLKLPSFSDRSPLPAAKSLHVAGPTSWHDKYTPSSFVSHYSSSTLGGALSHRTGFSKMEEASPAHTSLAVDAPLSHQFALRRDDLNPSPLQRQPLNFTSYSRVGSGSPTADHLPRSQFRFDPFTGEPYKFDPFTGEPIRADSLSHRAGSQY